MQHADVFGAVSLGYVVIESERMTAWTQFFKDGLGLHTAATGDRLSAFRLDDHARRFIVRKGPQEDVAAAGFELRDDGVLEIVARRLRDQGIPIAEGSPAEAEARGVERFWRVTGPKRLDVEFFTTPRLSVEPLEMLSSGFVTGAGGLGHVVMTTRRPEEMLRFWQGIFDARVSDRVEAQIGGMTIDITFLRLNERHHSIAFAAVRGPKVDPIRTRVQHVDIVASSLGDVTAAYRRLRALGFTMAHEIGQHPNDRAISFYVHTPSGFELEMGCESLLVDEATWKPGAVYNEISLWGHKPTKSSRLDMVLLNLGNMRRGVASMRRPEYSPFVSGGK